MFEPSSDPTGFFVYAPSLAIMNPDNHQQLNSILEINFITSGTNDLAVTLQKGSIKFIELKCNSQLLAPVIEDNKLFYKGYACSGNGQLSVKILSRETRLELAFGSKKQQVQNIAS